MGLNLHLLILGIMILCLSSVNVQQIIIQPGYNYYRQTIQPYLYTSTPKQTIKLISSDPKILQRLQEMNLEELQNLVNKKILPYFREYSILHPTKFGVQIENPEARSGDGLLKCSLSLPIIKKSTLTNITPNTLVLYKTHESNVLIIEGIEKLGQTVEYYQLLWYPRKEHSNNRTPLPANYGNPNWLEYLVS